MMAYYCYMGSKDTFDMCHRSISCRRDAREAFNIAQHAIMSLIKQQLQHNHVACDTAQCHFHAGCII
jgi:hypothetical protein